MNRIRVTNFNEALRYMNDDAWQCVAWPTTAGPNPVWIFIGG